jgi:hypothetical protein
MIAPTAPRPRFRRGASFPAEVLVVLTTQRHDEGSLRSVACALRELDGRPTLLARARHSGWWAFSTACGVAVPGVTDGLLIEARRQEIEAAVACIPELDGIGVECTTERLSRVLPRLVGTRRFGHILVAASRVNAREWRVAESLRRSVAETCSADVVLVG